MSTDTLRELLKRTPFDPFEVRMSNGDAHQVRHPEFAFVTKGNLVVGAPDSDRIGILSLLHIAAVQMLNGARKQ